MKKILGIIGLIVLIAKIDAQNVGIGTNEPESRLHVVGDIRSDSLMLSMDSVQTEVLRVESLALIQQNILSNYLIYNNPAWQSFTAHRGGSNLRVSIYLLVPNTITQIKLYAGEGVNSDALFTQDVTQPTQGWVTFPVIPVTIHNGQMYTIWFNNGYSIGRAGDNPYTGGMLWATDADSDEDMMFKIHISDKVPVLVGGEDAALLSMPRPGSLMEVNGAIRGNEIFVGDKLGVGTMSITHPLAVGCNASSQIMSIHDQSESLKWQWKLAGSNLELTTGDVSNKVLTITSSSGIGMGTDLPQAFLHLSTGMLGSGTSDVLLLQNEAYGGVGIQFKNPVISQNLWQCFVENDGKFKIGREGLDDYMTIATNGNVTFSGLIANEPVSNPTLLNSWVNYGVGFQTAGYFKDKVGIIHLHGLIKNGNNAHVMTLPSGYRPTGIQIFTVVSGTGFARLDINPDGTVVLSGSYNNAYVSLNGITFRT